MKNTFESFEERLEKTKKFYESFDVEISKDVEELAIQSLTMPQYAKEYNESKECTNKIYDNTSLATLGDAVCGVYLMNKEFNNKITKKDLSNKKTKLRNDRLNILGKAILSDFLFQRNNDCKGTKKSFATNFEAFIGFIYKVNPDKAFEILDDELKNI